MKLEERLCRIADVTDSQRSEMFALMVTYYENINRPVFDADLDEKQWVIQLADPITGVICGFSTQMLLDLEVGDRPIRALFSGDTIVDPNYWNKNSLAQSWGQFALSLIDANPAADLYWFLISKGYKTYRFLPLFFHVFYPRYDAPTPVWASELIDRLGRIKYSKTYDPQAGIVRADRESCRLRPGVAEITESRLRYPHVRFFAEQNPGHTVGDELCCIAPLTRENFTPAAYRVIGPAPTLSVVPP